MTVKFFSNLRTLTQCSEMDFPISQPISVEKLWGDLIARFPELQMMRNSVRIAKNHEYVGDESTFENSDEVALIPPVSGG